MLCILARFMHLKVDENRTLMDVCARESTKGKWAVPAKLVGAKERVEGIGANLVEH